jgi:salicylate hydroxylase
VPCASLPRYFIDEVCTIWMGPGAHPVAYYLRRGELLNFVGLVESDSWREESWTVKDSWEHRRPVTGWSTARATLLGDAAHPTLPFLAFWAAMAIEDRVMCRCHWPSTPTP